MIKTLVSDGDDDRAAMLARLREAMRRMLRFRK
jgi:hypothetical protein